MTTNIKKKNKWKKKSPIQTDYFIINKIHYIDYKKVETLRKFVNRQGQIIPRFSTQLTAKNQRDLAKAIKNAREMALLPYEIVDQND